MNKIHIVPDSIYQGEGISKGLARGLLVYYDDQNLTGEGMGIGSIAIRDQECTYFSRSWTDSSGAGVLRRTFTLDTRMRWSILGKPSNLLTRWIEFGISAYMQLPWWQETIMLPVPLISTLLGIHPLFETIPSRGKVTFAYRVTENTVDVQVDSDMPVKPQDTLCLLNELSAAWFTAGWDGERPVSPPPGWEKVSSSQLPVSLLDPVHGIRFFMDKPTISISVPHSIYRGREQTREVCWAGFCIELGPFAGSQGFTGVRYCIGFEEGECR
jgi:hypothetical protein